MLHSFGLSIGEVMKNTLKIAQLAPLYESVPPKLYGGTERVVSYLADGLVQAGHEVTLFASGDSTTEATLISPLKKALRLDEIHRDPAAAHGIMLDMIQCSQNDFDLIHFHCEFAHFPLLRHLRVPTLTTLHGRLDQAEASSICKRFLDTPLCSISYAQRAPLPWNHWSGNVYHGLPLELLRPCYEPENYLAFLGRISPEKGVEKAVEISLKLGIPLKIAAKIDEKDKSYFEEIVSPLLNNPLVEYVGEIEESDKSGFLGRSRALLFPIDWPEPFGMAMIEAMACGSPVLAFDRGSVPEVVDDGLTGYLVNCVEGAVNRADEVFALDRRAVRARFERRFSSRRMVEDYVEVYRNLIGEKEASDVFAGGGEMGAFF